MESVSGKRNNNIIVIFINHYHYSRLHFLVIAVSSASTNPICRVQQTRLSQNVHGALELYIYQYNNPALRVNVSTLFGGTVVRDVMMISGCLVLFPNSTFRWTEAEKASCNAHPVQGINMHKRTINVLWNERPTQSLWIAHSMLYVYPSHKSWTNEKISIPNARHQVYKSPRIYKSMIPNYRVHVVSMDSVRHTTDCIFWWHMWSIKIVMLCSIHMFMNRNSYNLFCNNT